MIHKLLASGAIAAAVISFAPVANAGGVDKDGGFYATPVQKGAPRDLPGEQVVPGANIAVDVIDGVVRPVVVDPIQGAGASLALLGGPPAAAAPAAPVVHKHHHHHHHHHHH